MTINRTAVIRATCQHIDASVSPRDRADRVERCKRIMGYLNWRRLRVLARR